MAYGLSVDFGPLCCYTTGTGAATCGYSLNRLTPDSKKGRIRTRADDQGMSDDYSSLDV